MFGPNMVDRSLPDHQQITDISLTHFLIFMEVDNEVDNILIHILLIYEIKELSFKVSWNHAMKHNGMK